MFTSRQEPAEQSRKIDYLLDPLPLRVWLPTLSAAIFGIGAIYQISVRNQINEKKEQVKTEFIRGRIDRNGIPINGQILPKDPVYEKLFDAVKAFRVSVEGVRYRPGTYDSLVTRQVVVEITSELSAQLLIASQDPNLQESSKALFEEAQRFSKLSDELSLNKSQNLLIAEKRPSAELKDFKLLKMYGDLRKHLSSLLTTVDPLQEKHPERYMIVRK